MGGGPDWAFSIVDCELGIAEKRVRRGASKWPMTNEQWTGSVPGTFSGKTSSETLSNSSIPVAVDKVRDEVSDNGL
jgi:hypothetical protein